MEQRKGKKKKRKKEKEKDEENGKMKQNIANNQNGENRFNSTIFEWIKNETL